MAYPNKLVGVLFTAFLIGLGLGHEDCLGAPLALQGQTIAQQATSTEGAMQLLNQGMEQMESRRFSDALRSLREALSRFQRNGNKLQTAHTLNALSELYAIWSFGDNDLALEFSQQALSLARQENDPSLEATALARMARAHNLLEAYPKAIDSAQASLKILKEDPNPESEGRALLSLSYAYNQLNDKDKALAYAQQAISLAQKSNDRKREVVALRELGQRYLSQTQDYTKAMESYQQALKIASSARDMNGQLDTLSSIYSLYNMLKKYDKSISYRTQGLELTRQIGDRITEAFTLQDLGNAYQDSGQPVRALEAYQQSLAVAQKAKDVRLEAAVLANIGRFYQGRRDYAQTFGYYQQSLKLYQQLQLRSSVLSTLHAIAGVHYSLNDYSMAIATYEEALVIARELKKRSWEGSILTSIGNAHYSRRQYAPSISFYSRALTIYEELQRPKDQSTLLTNIGDAYGELKDYRTKAVSYQRAIAVDRAMKNINYEIVDMINLASVYVKNLNDRSKAVAYYQQALSIARSSGDRNLERTTLMSLGSAYSSQLQDIPQGVIYHSQALAIARDQIRPELASTLGNVALEYFNLGATEQAMVWAQEGLVLAKKSQDVSTQGSALMVLGGVQVGRGDFQQAIRSFQQALTIARTTQNRSLELGTLHGLASAYSIGPGNKTQSLELYQQALVLSRQLRNLNMEALILSMIGNRYQLLSDHAQAIYYAQQGLAISRQTGSESTELLALGPLFMSHEALGDQKKAYAYGQRFLELSRKKNMRTFEGLALVYLRSDVLGRKDLQVERNLPQQAANLFGDSPVFKYLSRSLLANNYAQIGNNLKAIALARQNVSSAKALKLPILVAESLHNLGVYNRISGSYQAAIRAFQEALVTNPAPDTPGSNYETFAELAKTYRRLKQTAVAISYYKKAVDSEVLYLQGQLPLLPEAGRQPLIETFGNRWEAAFSLAGHSPDGTTLALFTRLNRHGLLLDIERRQALLSRAPGPQQRLAQELTALTSRLADVSLAEPKRKALQQQREQQEQELYRLLPAFQPRLVEPEQVARALPADGVLVEFQRFRPYDANQPEEKAWGDARYLALLLRPHGHGGITAVDLGAAAAIDKLIETALAATQKELPNAMEAWSALAQRIHSPLQPHLADRRQWFISPDGELHRVPFEALRKFAAAGKQPAQAVQLYLLTSGRDLLQSQSNTGTAGQSLVLADPETFGDWPRLPATGKEGRQVARDLGATLLEGKQASVSALQQARGPKVLHVASFGSFSPAPASGDPLLASVIVLAGADRRAMPNQKPSDRPATTTSAPDDGYLTAREAAQLQLDGTQLVVLSACDTGVGQVQSGEGIYGMQRALTVAGARSTLLSLWKVDDEATAWFMRRYYEQLKGGRGRMEALQDVQEEFRDRPKLPGWSHPIYWAAWQLTGDGDPLSK